MITNGCGISIYVFNPFETMEVKEENYLKSDVVIYPNPSRNEFMVMLTNLHIGKLVNIKLINENGLIIKSFSEITASDTYHLTLDTHQFKKGIYLLQIDIGNKRFNRKIAVL
jgi:hypothetical protein